MPPQSRHLMGTMRWWRTVTVSVAGINLCVGAYGASGVAQAQTPCSLRKTDSGTVASVLDGRSFRLTDGREIRLAGIEVPLMARAGETPQPAAVASKNALESLLANREVSLEAATAGSDRFGRIPAFAFAPGSRVPAQYSMLAAGHARASADFGAPACHSALLAQEAIARKEKIGLWADPAFALFPADPPERVAAQRGHFAVVEGKVLSVRSSGATTYLNFGRRWIEGFAVTIRKRDERAFAAAGLSPKSLEGRTVRVRGFIEQRGGPRIEAALPQQFEIVGGI
jgi:endonuclease YncB( thermonuclease family)